MVVNHGSNICFVFEDSSVVLKHRRTLFSFGPFGLPKDMINDWGKTETLKVLARMTRLQVSLQVSTFLQPEFRSKLLQNSP